MAKLLVLPEQWIIDKYKGLIDFYEWNGIPCARKWPVHPPRTPTEAEQHNQDQFKLAHELKHQLPPYIVFHLRRVAAHYKITWFDLFFRTWMKGHRG